MVTCFPVEKGILSTGAIYMLTLVTNPPSMGVPPVAPKSRVVETVKPVPEAAMGPPIVAPVRVSVCAPAGIAEVVATTYWGAVPEVVVAKPVPAAPMVPEM